MTQTKRDNQHRILRYLYHERVNYETTSDIAEGTDLTRGQILYADDEWLREYVDVGSDETRGDIEDANAYTLNSQGRQYVRENGGEALVEQQNRREIEKIEKEIITLRSHIEGTEHDLNRWVKYSSEWTDNAQKRFEAIEQRLKNIEDALLE